MASRGKTYACISSRIAVVLYEYWEDGVNSQTRTQPVASGGSTLGRGGDTGIGADFRFEVPWQSSVALIGGGRDQWLGGAPWRVQSTSL